MAEAGWVPVRVTSELLAAGRSARGGWSAMQLALVGVPWPPPAGWQATAIGRLIPRDSAERFVALRGGPPPDSGGLFGGVDPEAEPGAAADGGA